MAINLWAVLVSAIIAMVLGFVWHGPLFGKKYNAAMGMTMPTDPEMKKRMMKGMNKIYIIQFLLFVVEMWVLAKFVTMSDLSGLTIAFWIWLGFVATTVASAAMWTDKSSSAKWTVFFISAGFNLVALGISGWIIGAWH